MPETFLQANGKGESPLSVSEKNGFREVVPTSGLLRHFAALSAPISDVQADLLKSAGALPPKGGKKKGRNLTATQLPL